MKVDDLYPRIPCPSVVPSHYFLSSPLIPVYPRFPPIIFFHPRFIRVYPRFPPFIIFFHLRRSAVPSVIFFHPRIRVYPRFPPFIIFFHRRSTVPPIIFFHPLIRVYPRFPPFISFIRVYPRISAVPSHYFLSSAFIRVYPRFPPFIIFFHLRRSAVPSLTVYLCANDLGAAVTRAWSRFATLPRPHFAAKAFAAGQLSASPFAATCC